MTDDDRSILQEYEDLRQRVDRLESLVGTAYGASGTVRPALENAVLQQDVEQLRQEVQAVLNFLRDNDPAGG